MDEGRSEVVRLQAAEPVEALLSFARTHQVAHILLGRSEVPRWKRLWRPSMVQRMVDAAADFDLHIISMGGNNSGAPP